MPIKIICDNLPASSLIPSLIAVHGAPSSCSSLISLRATRLPVSLLRPLNTVAYVPCKTVYKHILRQGTTYVTTVYGRITPPTTTTVGKNHHNIYINIKGSTTAFQK